MVLSCQVHLLEANGTKIANSKEVAIANDFLNCLWKNSSVHLNNVPVNSSSDFHYYKSGLASLIESTREQSLTSEMQGGMPKVVLEKINNLQHVNDCQKALYGFSLKHILRFIEKAY